jgi:hypothetical protein
MNRLCVCAIILASMMSGALAQDDPSAQILTVKRVYVDKLTGGETAAQMRDLIIASLQGAKLFVLTENPERADAVLRGAAEDLVFTDTFQSSESVDLRSSLGTGSRGSAGTGSRSTRSSSSSLGRGLSAGIADRESTDIKERKHEALATVRLVNKDGDVLWSTTQESNGAKFRGASADVADKIARALLAEVERLRKSR